MIKKTKKDIALQETTLKTYKLRIKPCVPFPGSEGKGELVEITTDNLRYSMDEYQRNRLPYLWDVVSTSEPKQ